MNDQYEKRIGECLRQRRIKNGCTQEELAAKMQLEGCDVSRTAIAKIEAGIRHIYTWEIKALAKVLNITYDDILG